jgi:hypothetical protein
VTWWAVEEIHNLQSPILTMVCGPENPPYASSWFQCAMDTLLSGALHPYSGAYTRPLFGSA